MDGDCLQYGENCCSLERCFVADNGIYCSEMLVGGAARVQVPYVILAPLHINIKCVTCAFLSIVWRRMKM